jgi:hypothetical protein
MKKKHKTDMVHSLRGPTGGVPGDLRAQEAVLLLAQGRVLEHIAEDEESGLPVILRVWFSPRCSCFHFAVNGVFRGIYTGSFFGFRETCLYGRDVRIAGPGRESAELGYSSEDRVCRFYQEFQEG